MNKKVERLIKEPYSSQIVCNNKWWLENGDGSGLPIEHTLRNEAEHIDKCVLYSFSFSKATQGECFWWDLYHRLRRGE